MQKVILIFALLALGALASDIPINTAELKSLWSSWKIYYGKAYTAAEEAARFAIFEQNYKKVIEHNAVSEDYKKGLNKFSDLTSVEFKSIYASGYVKKNNRVAAPSVIDYSVMNLGDGVDWRTKGAVTKVKDQGQCGSCWTFATTGVLEGFYQINNGKLLSFSEQQIVDCDKNDDGCDGGDPVEALTYTADNGLELELTYPYKAEDGSCKFKKAVAVQTNGGSSLVTAQSTDALKTALNTGVVSVAIEADQDVFQDYSSGVIGKGCGDSLDHAVLVVGWGTVGSTEVFIVKNSWGTSWGEEGYFNLDSSDKLNNGNGACGVLSQPVVPTK